MALISFMQSITPPCPPPPAVPESNEDGEGEAQTGIEGKNEAEEYVPPTVAAALSDYAWVAPDTFTETIVDGLPTS